MLLMGKKAVIIKLSFGARCIEGRTITVHGVTGACLEKYTQVIRAEDVHG